MAQSTQDTQSCLEVMAKTPAGQTQSRFLRLPAEIRVYIYELVFSGEYQRFHNILLPATSQVSSQVRNESLPVFFSQASFEILIGANMTQIHPRFLPPSAVDDRLDSDYAGLLLLDQRLAGILEVADSQNFVTIRKVTFQVSCSGNIGFAVRRDYTGLADFTRALETSKGRSAWDSFQTEVLDLSCEGSSISSSPSPLEAQTGIGQSVKEIFANVVEAAESICQPRDFRGFTLNDLRVISRCFRKDNV